MNKRIVNADDFGASLSINQAIDYAFKEGIINYWCPIKMK